MSTAIGRLPVSYGLAWFGRGWRGFARAPGLLIGVLFLWLIVAIGLGFIPLLGSLVFMLISPALFGGYLLMCRAANEESQPSLEQFFSGLTRAECRTEAIVLGVLLIVGYVVVLVFCVAAFALIALAVLGTIPWEAAQAAPEEIATNIGVLLVLALTILVALIPYTALAMAFTYGAPLVLENKASAFEALSLSFRACLINILPLSVFALLYLLFLILAMIPLGLGLLVFVPVSMAAIAASYADIFGE